MTTVKEIEKTELERLVRIAYLGDDEGIYKFHVEPLDYEGGVKKTLCMIGEMEQVTPMKYYEVDYNGMPIGFFVFCKEILYSFGINIVYRTKRTVLTDWWGKVVKVIGGGFGCVLQRNNTRAINFLQRLGMQEIDAGIDDKSLITLVNV